MATRDSWNDAARGRRVHCAQPGTPRIGDEQEGELYHERTGFLEMSDDDDGFLGAVLGVVR